MASVRNFKAKPISVPPFSGVKSSNSLIIKTVEALRQNGVDAVPFFDDATKLPNKVVVSKTGLQTPFVAPENQIWIEESYYEEYARDISAIYECSDGTLTRSYAEFKSWEKELSIRPNNPNYDVLPNDVSISDIEHYEVASDGTLWRDASLLQEYLGWRKNPSYNYVNGYYCGVYGVANSFLEYAKIHNASYFILQGLRRAEQFIDPINNFLFVSQSRVDEYVKSIKSFQKII